MDYVISHNADGVREFRRVSEAEPRLEAVSVYFWESENLFVSVVAFGHVEMTQRACFPPDPICVLIATLCWQDVETWKTGAHVEAFGIRKLSLSIQDAASLQWEAELEGCWEEYQRRSPERESHFRWNIGMISKFYWNSSLFVPASFDILHHSSHPLFLWHMSSINEYLRYGYIYLERATSAPPKWWTHPDMQMHRGVFLKIFHSLELRR